jgi:hypothetical protein
MRFFIVVFAAILSFGCGEAIEEKTDTGNVAVLDGGGASNESGATSIEGGAQIDTSNPLTPPHSPCGTKCHVKPPHGQCGTNCHHTL